MLFHHARYPTPELPPVAATLLEGFHANERCRAHDFEGGVRMSEVDYERCCALYEGARQRALHAGGKDSHGDQAATLLVMIDELEQLLDGTLSVGGKLSLDSDELDCLRGVRQAAEQLLRWHVENGAGALLPMAIDLGLVHGAAA